MTELCGEPKSREAGGETCGESKERVFGAISTEDEKEKQKKQAAVKTASRTNA
jgi:hypothetical protein